MVDINKVNAILDSKDAVKIERIIDEKILEAANDGRKQVRINDGPYFEASTYIQTKLYNKYISGGYKIIFGEDTDYHNNSYNYMIIRWR